MKKTVSFLLMTVAICAWSVERPSLEQWRNPDYPIEFGAGESKTLSEIMELLEERQNDSACREAYKKAESDYLEAHSAWRTLVEKGAQVSEIEAAYEKVVTTKEAYFQKMELGADACGDCVTPVVKEVIIDEGVEPELWFESHGICRIGNVPAESLAKGHAEATRILRTPKAYENKHGGFPAILEFLGIDDAKTPKVPLPDLGPVADGVFHAFMAVRAEIPRLGFIAFKYYIENTVRTVKSGNNGEVFDLSFRQAPGMNEFRHPPIFDYSPVNPKEEEKPRIVFGLDAIVGWWYIDTEAGVLRYSTAAKFPQLFASIKQVAIGPARRTHLETVATIKRRFYNGLPLETDRAFDLATMKESEEP